MAGSGHVRFRAYLSRVSPRRVVAAAQGGWGTWLRLVGQPPEGEAWQKDWLYRISSAILLLQHVIVVACGVAWLIAPSNSVSAVLDPGWSGAWSAMFVLFAGAGATARLKRAWPVEAACNILVAISVWLWAMVILLGTLGKDLGGLQTGLMLLAFAASLWGWSLTQISYLRRKEAAAQELRAAVTAELDRRLRGV